MEKIISHYTKCLLENRGNLVKETDWDTEEKLNVRYKVMADLFYTPSPGEYNTIVSDKILDFGCGTGTFLQKTPLALLNYWGCDASMEMITEAKSRYLKYADRFFHAPLDKELISSFDWIICNGVFTEKRDYSWDEMYKYTKSTLTMLLKHTRKGLAVNFMNAASLPVNTQRSELFFLDPGVACKLAKDLGVSKYVLRTDYLPYEISLYFFK